MHILNKLGSVFPKEHLRIQQLLNFDFVYPDDERKRKLEIYIEKFMLDEIVNINSENDIKKALRKLPHLNDVAVIVKDYFKLS